MSHALKKGNFEVFDASGYKVGIVVGKFNDEITSLLLENAKGMLGEYGVKDENIETAIVSGCVEIPLILKKMAESKKYDILMALGAVVRGSTAHFEYVAKIACDGVLQVQMEHGIPVGFGILTTENEQQAMDRVNAGAWAAEAALHSAKTIKDM